MSMFNYISCEKKDNEEECLATAEVVSKNAKTFGMGQLSFIGSGSEKKWYSMEENRPQGIRDHIADEMLLEFAESGHPIFRATTPLSRGSLKSRGHGKLSIHYCADQKTIETICRIIAFANQLSLYGAVANMCEEFESLHDRSGQPDVLMGQSIILSEIKTEVPLENDDPAFQNFLLQRYEERIKSLSQMDRVSKFCMDARFLSFVDIVQYFMTKDTGEQFHAKACREYTLPRNDGSSQPKGWIQGNTKIGPVLEVTTSYLYGKHGIEIRIWSLSEDNTQSWVRFFHGSNNFVIDSNYNNTESPEDLPEEEASQLKVKDFACRSEAKAKPQRREPADYSPSIIPMNDYSLSLCVRGFEEGNPSSSSFSILERRQTVFFLPIDPRDKEHKDPEKIDLNVPRRAQYLHNAWKKHQDAENWVDINLAIRRGLTFYQTRSDAIILQGILPAYCIPKILRLKTGEVLHEKAYMSPRPPPKISLRHGWTEELDSKVVQQPEGKVVQQPGGEVARQAKFFQPTQPIPSPNCDRSGQLDITQDVIRKTSRSQEISVNSFNEELCSSDKSGRPGITQDVISVQACSSEDSESLNVEQTHDRSGRPGKDTVAVQDDPEVYHEIKTLNTDDETIRERIEEDMDFKIPGLPHSTVKQTHSASVRELIHRKSRTIQTDMLFNETYDKIIHLIPSVQNQNK